MASVRHRFHRACVAFGRYRRSNLAVLAGYALLTLLMTYPLAAQLGTHAAGSGNDMWVSHWNNWWVRRTLIRGGSVYRTQDLFYPQGISLLWHSFSWSNVAFWLILQPLVGPLAAHGLIVLLSYALSAYTAYLLAYEVTRSRSGAFLAGLVFGFYPAHHAHHNQLKFLSTQWVPLCAFYTIRVSRRGRLRDGLKAGVCFALCALSSVQLFLLAALWIALWLVYTLAAERHDWNRRSVRALALALLTCALLAGPLLAPLVIEFMGPESAQDLTASTVAEKRTDLLAYLVPSEKHPVVRQNTVVNEVYERWLGFDGRAATIGYGVLFLIAWAVVRRRRRARFWVFSALVPAVLSLGSALQVNGREISWLILPYRLLVGTPVGAIVRNPERFNLLLALPVAILVAIGASNLLARLRIRSTRVAAVTGLAMLVLFEYLAVPFPTTAPIRSRFYGQLGEEPGALAVADFPIGFHAHDKWYMYAQTLHERPMVGGHVSRVPVDAHEFIDEVPLLTAARIAPPARGDLDDVSRQLAPLAEAGVRYVIVHKDRIDSNGMARWREWFAFRPHFEDEYVLVFRSAPQYGEDVRFIAEAGDGIGIASAVLSSAVVPQEGLLEAEIVWATAGAPGRDWQARLALVDSAGRQAQGIEFAPCSGWPTSGWGEGAVAHGRGALQVDPFMGGGTYTATVTLLDAATGERAGEPVQIGRVSVQEIERVFDAPDVDHEMNVLFGGNLRLLGYDLSTGGDAARVVLHWQALRRLGVALKFFVHVCGPGEDEVVAQADVMPRDWMYPTTWWEAGEIVSDGIDVSLAGVPAGAYRVRVGVYEPGGERLLASTGGDSVVLDDDVVVR